jgi:hypothetical protein
MPKAPSSDNNHELPTIRDYSSVKPKVVDVHVETNDRIVWDSRAEMAPTIIPNEISSDPFMTGLVRYFNSSFFRNSTRDPSVILKYRLGIEALVSVVIKNDLKTVPINIYALTLAKLRDSNHNEYAVYRIYTCVRSPSYKLGGTGRFKGIDLAKFRAIKFTKDEHVALYAADQSAPKVTPPPNSPKVDLIEFFNLQDHDGEKLIKSLREFCCFYLGEWHNIRNEIYDTCQEEVAKLLSYAADESPDYILGSGYSKANKSMHEVLWVIVQKINHPFLTERFVTIYLGLIRRKGNWHKDGAAPIILSNYDLSQLDSTALSIDWIGELKDKLVSSYTGKLVIPNHTNIKTAFKAIRNRKVSRSLPKLTTDWVGSFSGTMNVRDLLGISISEEICFSWLMSSDRHQPSNLRLMIIEDIVITDNSVTTIIDPKSLKRRNKTLSGKSYSVAGGETYKKSVQNSMFQVISEYVKNIERAYTNNLVHPNPDIGRQLLPLISAPNEKAKDGQLGQRYFAFSSKKLNNIQLLFCSMQGSLSNEHVLHNSPDAKVFLELIKQSAFLNAGDNRGKWRIGHEKINRQVVNNSNGKFLSNVAIHDSSSNQIQFSNEEVENEMELEASEHNHSLATKLQVYADKLPAYLTKKANFGARVGQEIVNFAIKLSESSNGVTELLTAAEIRAKLGFETVLERESHEDLNLILEQVEMQEFIIDDLGFIADSEGKTIVIRHPITIALMKAKINAIDEQVEALEYSNPKRLMRVLAQRIYLAMLLDRKFTESEIKESEVLYKDVVFPMSDILV